MAIREIHAFHALPSARNPWVVVQPFVCLELSYVFLYVSKKRHNPQNEPETNHAWRHTCNFLSFNGALGTACMQNDADVADTVHLG